MTITIQVDRIRCSGHARCALKGPDVYSLDENGYCSADGRRVDESLRQQAIYGMKACPERAITMAEIVAP